MERRIVPLDTELDVAPTNPEQLGEMLGGFACQQACRFKRPRSDRHHLIFGEHDEAVEALRSLPEFIIRICRCKHEVIHATWQRSGEVGI